MTLALRDYQVQAVERTLDAWRRGDLAVLGQAATGLGKTIIGIAIVKAALDAGGGHGRTLWLAHRDELLRQPLDQIRRWLPGVRAGLVKAGIRQYDADIVVGSVQSLQRRRLPELPRFDVVVVDEAHHAVLHVKKAEDGPRDVVGNTYGVLLTHLRRQNAALRVLGLTATPDRADDVGLGGCFAGRYGPDGLPAAGVRHGVCAFAYDIAFGIEHGWLCPVRGLRVLTATNLTEVRTAAGEFIQGDLARAVNTAARNRMVAEAWAEHARGRRTIAFSVDVGDVEERAGHVFTLAEAFRTVGARTEAIWGAMPTETRADVLRRYRGGELDVVVNVGVLTEGFDAPETSCIVMARPTKSLGLYVQMVGRGTRPATGKTDLLVLDCADVSKAAVRTLLDLHVPGAVDHVSGELLDTKMCRRKGCTGFALPQFAGFCSEACQAWRPTRPTELPVDEAGRLDWHAVEVDLFAGEITWGRVGPARVLGLGDRRIVIVYPDGEGHRAAVVDHGRRTVIWLTFGAEPEAEALSAAETMLRRSGVHGRAFSRQRNHWFQEQKPTEDQARLLSLYGFAPVDVFAWSRAKATLVLDWAFARDVIVEDLRGDRLDSWRRRAFAKDFSELTSRGRSAA